MARDNYERCLAFVLKYEGGKCDDPQDPGGRTAYGITQRVFTAFLRRRGISSRDVYTITQDEKEAIYREQYWSLIKGDELPYGIDLAIFDCAVNSGPTRAVRMAQELLGIRSDGDMANVTIAHLRDVEAPKFIRQYCDARLGFLRKLATFGRFGRGWTARVQGIERNALAMVVDDHGEKYAALSEPLEEQAAANADPRALSVASTGTGRGGLTAAVGIAGTTLSDVADKVDGVKQYSQTLTYLFIALTVLGVALTLYATLAAIKREGTA